MPKSRPGKNKSPAPTEKSRSIESVKQTKAKLKTAPAPHRAKAQAISPLKGAPSRPRGGGRSHTTTCRVIGCTQPATTSGYSRICYIKYWKQIKQKEQILAQGTLQKFIKELVEKYPEKVIEAIQHDLSSDDAYASMIRDLDLYGGIDELEHAANPVNMDDEEAAENDLDDIKKGMDKDDDLF